MSRTAIRWGYIYLMTLLVLAGIGLITQKQQAELRSYQAKFQELEQEQRELLVEYEARLSSRAVALWAESHGMVPMSQGRWAE
ncbi:hypothetical protein [Oceanithermus sp.]